MYIIQTYNDQYNSNCTFNYNIFAYPRTTFTCITAYMSCLQYIFQFEGYAYMSLSKMLNPFQLTKTFHLAVVGDKV